MKIAFRKIPYTKSSFEISSDRLICEGTFQRESNKMTLADIKVSGQMSSECDRCGITFDLSVDEKLAIKICDGVSSSEDLDIIECLDHIVDFDEIIQSEIASIRSDYHYCDICKKEEGK